MKRGKSLIEVLRSRTAVPYERVIESESGTLIYRYYPLEERFTLELQAGSGFPSRAVPLQDMEDALIPVLGWNESSRPERSPALNFSVALFAKIPRLAGRKVDRAGRPQRIEASEPESSGRTITPEPAEPRKTPQKTEAARPREKPVTIAPEKVKRVPAKEQPKPRPVKMAPVVEEPPKPLKVIRRRGHQEPIVFETAPKVVPQAMLEGVKLKPDRDGGDRAD